MSEDFRALSVSETNGKLRQSLDGTVLSENEVGRRGSVSIKGETRQCIGNEGSLRQRCERD